MHLASRAIEPATLSVSLTNRRTRKRTSTCTALFLSRFASRTEWITRELVRRDRMLPNATIFLLLTGTTTLVESNQGCCSAA
jgi:hypothetical protein